MAITTNTGKLGVMEWCQVYEPGLPLLPGVLGGPDQRQLLWDYPELVTPVALFVVDLNTRLRVYLADFYGYSDDASPDLTMLMERYLKEELTGDYDTRLRQLILDAS